MYCIQCGSPNPDTGVTCRTCGAKLVNPNHGQFSAPPGGTQSGNPYQASAVGPTGDSPFAGQPIGERPQNYLVWAILTTLCCGCWPFGIVAIVYAAQVDGKFASGDYAGAQASSNAAKMWCWVSFGLVMTVILAYVGMVLFLGWAGQCASLALNGCG